MTTISSSPFRAWWAKTLWPEVESILEGRPEVSGSPVEEAPKECRVLARVTSDRPDMEMDYFNDYVLLLEAVQESFPGSTIIDSYDLEIT